MQDDPSTLALNRTRRLAGGILAGLALVFTATLLVPDPSWTVRLIRAMAEAGMIGAIADWFAVEALFRHPLGLRIPHTALLPRNQAKAAANVGRFFDENFLGADTVRAALGKLTPGQWAVDWGRLPENAQLLSRHLINAMGGVLARDPPPGLAEAAKKGAREAFLSDAATETMTQSLGPALQSGLAGRLFDTVLDQVKGAVRSNRAKVTELVAERSRWWVASGIDSRVANLLVDGVASVLDDLAQPGSEQRAQLEQAFGRVIADMTADGPVAKAIATGKRHVVDSGAFDQAIVNLGKTAGHHLTGSVIGEQDQAAETIAAAIQALARDLSQDQEALARLDHQICVSAAQAIQALRPTIRTYVTDIIAGWDSDEMVHHFEAQIGRDLQFIRINGAVLGALIGGALYLLTSALGH